MSRLSVAVVGAGLMGRWHADAAMRAGARVAAIVDADLSRAKRLTLAMGAGRPYQDFGEIPAVDAVHVCTPAATHVGVARRAIAAGCHVLVEKPMAPSAPDVADLLDRAQANGLLACPVHQFLFQDGVRAALARLTAIGPLQHVAITMCSAGADGFDDRRRHEVALEILPHPVSLLGLLAPGRPVEPDWSIRHPAPGEVRALTELQHVTASIVISLAGRPPVNRMEIIGARGTMQVDLFQGFSVASAGRVSRIRKITHPFSEASRLGAAAGANLAKRAWRWEPAYPGLRRLIQCFYEAAASGGACPILPADVLWTARACDRLAAALAMSWPRTGHAP